MENIDKPVDFFDIHSRLPIVILALLPLVVHMPQWVLRLKTDPVWFFSGAVRVSDGYRGFSSSIPTSDSILRRWGNSRLGTGSTALFTGGILIPKSA